MKSVRLTAVLDQNGEVHIPVPVELRSSESLDVEVFFREPQALSESSWAEMVANIAGIFEDSPLELPDDPPPDVKDFGE